jgi:hypothetical protein
VLLSILWAQGFYWTWRNSLQWLTMLRR